MKSNTNVEVLSLGSCNSLITEKYKDWSDWSSCDVSCGNGKQTRSRKCVRTGSCFMNGALQIQTTGCTDFSRCEMSQNCALFFGEGFEKQDFGTEKSGIFARKCTLYNQNITSLENYREIGLPDGTSCELNCLHNHRLDADNHEVSCKNGEWDHVPKCVERGTFMECAPDSSGN